MADTDKKTKAEQNEEERLAKIEKLDSNQKRKKLIFACVTVFLVSLFVLGTVFGGKYILSYEGTQEMPTEEAELAELPSANEKEEANALLSDLLDSIADTNAVKLSEEGYFSLERDDITVINGFEGTDEYIDIIRDYICDSVGSFYSSDNYSEGFGNDFTSRLPDLSFTASAGFTCNEDEENPSSATLCFTAGEDAKEYFVPENADEIRQKLIEGISSMAQVSVESFEYGEFNTYFVFEREQNRLNSIKTERVLSGKLTLSFTGSYAEFGNVTLSFKAKIGKNYSFSRVSFNILSEVCMIEKGDSDEIKHSVVSDESPADVEIVWTSSDESILSIDGNFYKGHTVSETPVTVTGTYTYLGNVYTDECTFYVRIPTESIKLDKKSISLAKAGDTETLVPTVKPSDATLTEVKWFTSDENIATVDENGTVTAVSAGTTTVYAITVDGNFKKSCTVTVGAE